mgnify:CR=1 FL=1
MKRICIGLLTALGCIAVATALIVRPFSKKSIQSYVLRNQDELTNYARKVIEEHPMGPLEWNGWKVYLLSEECQSSSAFADKDMNYARLEAASVLVVLFVGAVVLIGMYLARKKRNN